MTVGFTLVLVATLGITALGGMFPPATLSQLGAARPNTPDVYFDRTVNNDAMMNVAMIIRYEATRSETSHQAISAPGSGTAVHGVRKSTRGSQPIGGKPCHADSSRNVVASNCTGHKRGTS